MTRILPLLLLLSAPLVGWSAAPIVVCYPGGPVNEADASAAMASMLRVVERVGDWPAHSFEPVFTANAEDCRNLLAEKRPGFAIVSLGLFLEQRQRHQLVPLVQPQIKGATREQYRLLVQAGRYDRIEALEGKSLGGTVLAEPEFVGRIVFAGRYDPARDFRLEPSRQALRALRALDKGELDAVIVNGQQFAGLGALNLQHPMTALFTSAEIPLMGMAANEKTTTSKDRARLSAALEAMCTDGEGKKLCDLFGVEAFRPADVQSFAPMIRLWERRP